MKILSTGDSVYGGSVIYEHGGKVYAASGGSSAQAICQVVDAISHGKIFGTPVGGAGEPEEDSQPELETTEDKE